MSDAARRGAWLKAAVWMLALAGAGLTIACIAHFGWRPLVRSFDVLGAAGFSLFCGYTLALFVLLGFCWFVIVPDLAASELPAFVFGRLMREAVSDILPLSQLGGFVLGARAAALLGAPAALATAASVIDIAAEMAGQLLFTLLGGALLLRDASAGAPQRLVGPILAAVLGGAVVLAFVFFLARRSVVQVLEALAGRLPRGMRDKLDTQRRALAALSHHPARAAASVALHFAAWLAAAGGVWLILALMDAPLSYGAVIEMESSVYLLRSAAFFVPGAIGVLEGGYVLIGPAFGLAPASALSLSLIKRARDLALGLPVLLGWQMLERRRFLTARLAAAPKPLG